MACSTLGTSWYAFSDALISYRPSLRGKAHPRIATTNAVQLSDTAREPCCGRRVAAGPHSPEPHLQRQPLPELRDLPEVLQEAVEQRVDLEQAELVGTHGQLVALAPVEHPCGDEEGKECVSGQA